MVKRLIWNDKRFNRVHRFKRPLLTLEEANERIHIRFPNMDILNYSGSMYCALIHCKDCGETFITKNGIGTYMYGKREYCESCRNKVIINEGKKLLSEIGLNFKSYYRKYCKGIGALIIINYACDSCGYSSNTRLINLRDGGLKYCIGCKSNDINNKYMVIGKKSGRKVKYVISSKVYSTHLFCGNTSTLPSENIGRNLLCKNCTNKVMHGKPKEHNKHLITECEKILKYTLDLKNEIEKQNLDLDTLKHNINYDYIVDIFEHIEGWYNNLITIKEKYPNGDLGTVLENNPHYINVWNIVVPAFENLLNE